MPRGSCAFLQTDVTRAVKAIVAAGMEVERIEIEKNGKIVVFIGKPDAPDDMREIVL